MQLSDARRCAIAGAAVVAITLAFVPWNPTRSCGVPSIPPILGFELATSAADLAKVFGEGACRAAMIASLRVVNQIDFAYMVAYGAFLFYGSTTRLGRVAAIAAPLADAIENLCLLSMDPAAPGGFLPLLMVASRAKFLLIGVVALTIGITTWRREKGWRRWLAVPQLSTLPALVPGVLVPAAMPIILPAVTASWLCLLAWSVDVWRRFWSPTRREG